MSPQTHTLENRTHGKDWCVSWRSAWRCCRRCESERRSWRRSERSARFSSALPSRSNPHIARTEAAGDPGSWGTSLLSSPSRQTPSRDTGNDFHHTGLFKKRSTGLVLREVSGYFSRSEEKHNALFSGLWNFTWLPSARRWADNDWFWFFLLNRSFKREKLNAGLQIESKMIYLTLNYYK